MMTFSLYITCSRKVDVLLTTSADSQGFRPIFSYLGLFLCRFVEYVCILFWVCNVSAPVRLA